MSRSSRASAWLVPIVLAAVLVITNFNIVFQGRSLVASANYHPFDARVTHLKPKAVTEAAFINWHDLGGAWWVWEPAGQAFSKAFRNWHLQMWEPNIGGGVDVHTQLTAGQYYPPYLLLLLAGNSVGLRDLYYLLQVFVAAYCCYLLLKRNGLETLGALAAAVAYMLGGTLTQNINSILGQSFAVLPVFVLLIDWLCERPSLARLGLSAIGIAICTLSSFMPVVLSGYLLMAIYGVVAAIHRPALSTSATAPQAVGARHLIVMLAAGALAVALVAFVLWPVRVLSSADPTFAQWYKDIGLMFFQFDQTLSFISPIVGYDTLQILDPAHQLFPLPDPATSHFFYVGLVPVLLAAFARPGRGPRERRLFYFFLAATVCFGLKLLGLPPAQWIGHLPVFSTLHFVPYMTGALALAVCGLAGCGVSHLMRNRPTTRDVVLGLAVLLAFALASLWFADTHAINSVMTPSALLASVLRMLTEGVRLLVLGGALVAFLVVYRRNGRAGLFGVLAVMLIAFELIPIDARARYGRADVYEQPPDFVRYLQTDYSQFRVHSIQDLSLTPNVSQGLGVAVLSSRMAFNSVRYSQLMRTYFKSADLPYPFPLELIPHPRSVLDVLNVKYLIAYSPSGPQRASLEEQGLHEVFDDGPFGIFQNASVWPRAYLAGRFTVVNTPDAALAAVAGLHPGDAVLEDRPSIAVPSVPGEQPAGTIDSMRYGDNQVTIDATVNRPAVLVLSDNFERGWTATVNGRPAPILRANYAFRGVEINGKSAVVFTYRTPGVETGAAVSAGALVVALGLVLLSGARRRPRAAPPASPAPRR